MAKLDRSETPKSWATAHARYAYANHRGRRAVFRFDGWVIVYDARPNALREQQINSLREWMRAEAIAELAFSIWPKAGSEKGYSYALVLDTVRSDDVYAALGQILSGERPTPTPRASWGRVLPFAPKAASGDAF
jgi:hypothetical protein